MPRAYTVSCDDVTCGTLSEGPGAFVSAARSGLEPPLLAHARYVSLDAHSELAISRALRTPTFDDALEALASAGYRLDPTAHVDSGGTAL